MITYRLRDAIKRYYRLAKRIQWGEEAVNMFLGEHYVNQEIDYISSTILDNNTYSMCKQLPQEYAIQLLSIAIKELAGDVAINMIHNDYPELSSSVLTEELVRDVITLKEESVIENYYKFFRTFKKKCPINIDKKQNTQKGPYLS